MILCAWLKITYEEMELQFFNYKERGKRPVMS